MFWLDVIIATAVLLTLPLFVLIAQRLGRRRIAFETHELLAAANERLGDYREALHHYRQFHEGYETLFNQEKLEGIEGLKEYLLLNRQDQFANALVHKMSAYALGRPMTFADRSEIVG